MRQPDFDLDLRRGQDSESELRDLLLKHGSRVEVKTDFQAIKTGNGLGRQARERDGSHPTMGFLVPVADLAALIAGKPLRSSA